MKLKKPKFWDYNKPSLFSYLLLPFTILIKVNNFFNQIKYNQKYLQNYKIKTICIGNIYVGGTGKTPLTIKIGQILKDLGYQAVFIKKRYIESYDEERLLAKYGNIISNPTRVKSLEEANKSYDVAVFDDGLQDRSIDYDLKFVCFNSNVFIGNGMLIPSGPLREEISSLKKYDAIFLNGKNDISDDIVMEIKKQNNNIEIFQCTYELVNLNSFNKKDKFIAFAGIGFPSNFYNTLVDNGFNIIKFLEYPDHYIYSNKNIEKIIDIAQNLDAKIITTEKDYSRLEKYNSIYKKNIKFIKMNLKVVNENALINFIKTKI
jgi:tetraacyldisaccharide 4'-kinase